MPRVIKSKFSMHKTLLFFVLCLSGCDLFKSDYEVLIENVKLIKLQEEKNGMAVKVFDGFAEPRFPLDDKLDDTLIGVDLNQDGVRDDIEIWINRTAESDAIRLTLKNYYRKFLYVISLANQIPDDSYTEAVRLSLVSGICMFKAGAPFDRDYNKKFGSDLGLVYNERLNILIANNKYRLDAYNRHEAKHYTKFATIKMSEVGKYCEPYLK